MPNYRVAGKVDHVHYHLSSLFLVLNELENKEAIQSSCLAAFNNESILNDGNNNNSIIIFYMGCHGRHIIPPRPGTW